MGNVKLLKFSSRRERHKIYVAVFNGFGAIFKIVPTACAAGYKYIADFIGLKYQL